LNNTRGLRTAIGGAVLAALLAACTGGSGQGPSPEPSSSAVPPTGSPAPAGEVKTVIQGLIDRQGEPSKKSLGSVHAYVVKVRWADLQPTAYGPITADNAIDQAIQRVRQPDYAAVHMLLKLRVLAGIDAPDWVKQLGGAPLPYVNNQDGGSTGGGSIGRFWTSDFGKAYADLQAKLAAKYDTVPELREITVSRCSTIFDELFVRQPGDARNVRSLLAGGYTVAADKQCIQDAITEHAVWRYTTSDVDFSPFPDVLNPGADGDVTYTDTMMTFCRSALGIRCGLQNNAISTSKLENPRFQTMYASMTKLGPPIILQTAARKRIGDPAQTLAAAVKIGANSVELPAGYDSWPSELLSSTAQALVANPLPSG